MPLHGMTNLPLAGGRLLMLVGGEDDTFLRKCILATTINHCSNPHLSSIIITLAISQLSTARSPSVVALRRSSC